MADVAVARHWRQSVLARASRSIRCVKSALESYARVVACRRAGGMSARTAAVSALAAAMLLGVVPGTAAAQSDTAPTGAADNLLILLTFGIVVVAAVRLLTDIRPLRAVGDVTRDAGFGRPGFGLGRIRTWVLVVLAVGIGALVLGVLGLPQSARAQALAVAALAAAYVTLRGFGAYDFRVYLVVAVATVLVTLSALGEPVIGAVFSSALFPLYALAGLYLVAQRVLGGSDDSDANGGGYL